MIFICGDRQSDGGSQQPFRFVGADLGQYAERDLPGQEFTDPLFKGDYFAIGGEDGGDINQIAFFYSGIAQGQFEGLQLGLVPADAFGKEYFFGNQPGIVKSCRLCRLFSLFVYAQWSVLHPY
jgi:hypothetical protein